MSFCDARRLLAAGDRLAIDDHLGSDLVTSAVGDGRGESFWATLKIEFHNRYLRPTKAAAKLALGDWIERVYNWRRHHSALGVISPVDFEDLLNQTAHAA